MAMENATHSRGWMSGCTWYVRSFPLVVLLLCIWATDISPHDRGSLNMSFLWPPCENLLSICWEIDPSSLFVSISSYGIVNSLMDRSRKQIQNEVALGAVTAKEKTR